MVMVKVLCMCDIRGWERERETGGGERGRLYVQEHPREKCKRPALTLKLDSGEESWRRMLFSFKSRCTMWCGSLNKKVVIGGERVDGGVDMQGGVDKRESERGSENTENGGCVTGCARMYPSLTYADTKLYGEGSAQCPYRSDEWKENRRG
jgi:hypothetical protein